MKMNISIRKRGAIAFYSLALLGLLMISSSCQKEDPKVVAETLTIEEHLAILKAKVEKALADNTLTASEREQIQAMLPKEKEKEVSKVQEFNRKAIDSEVVMFALVEQAPVFPGCENAADKFACFNEMMQKHIKKNFKYPEQAMEENIEGRVATVFTIDFEGNVVNIHKLGGNDILEAEAERIIGLLPKMTPGMQNGVPVAVSYTMPIVFKLK